MKSLSIENLFQLLMRIVPPRTKRSSLSAAFETRLRGKVAETFLNLCNTFCRWKSRRNRNRKRNRDQDREPKRDEKDIHPGKLAFPLTWLGVVAHELLLLLLLLLRHLLLLLLLRVLLLAIVLQMSSCHRLLLLLGGCCGRCSGMDGQQLRFRRLVRTHCDLRGTHGYGRCWHHQGRHGQHNLRVNFGRWTREAKLGWLVMQLLWLGVFVFIDLLLTPPQDLNSVPKVVR